MGDRDELGELHAGQVHYTNSLVPKAGGFFGARRGPQDDAP